jgi:ABC-type bacteriocin/lantibiotic exporter with double-glycine peptidase domain
VDSTSALRDLYCAALPSVEREPLPKLPHGLYRFVWRVSAPQQLRLCLLTALVFPLSMVPLELQRRIVNGAVRDSEVNLLLALGAVYLAVLLLQGGLKYVRNLYLGRVSEGVIRRLRTRVLRALGADDADAEEVGSRVSMIAAETEKLGGFVGESLAQPLLSTGILLTVAGYMLWTEPMVALVAFAFFVPALLVAPWLQRAINRHSKARTEHMRELSNQVVGGGKGTGEGGDQAGGNLEAMIQRIYDTRVRLFAVKFFAKFFNNLMGNIGQIAVLVAGGVLVIEGKTEIGIVVAFMSGFERISEPARELMNFYRQQSQMRVQYRLLQEVVPTVEQPTAGQ